MGPSPRPEVLGAHVGDAAPLSFVVSGPRGSPRRLLDTPGRGEGWSWEWGLGSLPPPVSGSPPVAAEEDGIWLLVGEAAESGGASLAPPSALPGLEGGHSYWRDRRRSEPGQAGSPGLEQLRGRRSVRPSLRCPQARIALRVAWGPGGRFHGRRPRVAGAHVALASAGLGPALPENQARLKLGEAPFGLAAEQNAWSPGWRAEEAGERAPRAAAERGPPAPGSSATPSELPGPADFLVLKVIEVEEEERPLNCSRTGDCKARHG